MNGIQPFESAGDLVAKLQENDRKKSEFLATLAHELRNPLAPIMYALESMSLMELNDEVDGLRQMMARQVNQIVHLIDDLLDVSRIGCGKIVLHKDIVAFQSIIDSAVEASSTFISENGQSLTVTNHCPEQFVFADSSRLTQVVSNLLNNSAKYSGTGSHIGLTVSLENGFLTIRVRDDGIGIAKDKLEDVFSLYSQISGSFERGTAGLGIGLTLARTFIELHGGTIFAESDGADQGSVFTVRLLPSEKPAEGELPNLTCADHAQNQSFRILIVDDQRALRLVMKNLLEKLGHQVEVAENALDAIAKLDVFSPEIIFSDINMPGMNGYELVRCLKKRADMAKVYMVALTGSGQTIDREAALESGFDEHLTKPVGIRRLRQLFSTLSLLRNNQDRLLTT